MPTILTYAKMANAVYDDSPSLPGWVRLGFRPSGSGLTDAFQGVAFKGEGSVVIVFKGTSNIVRDGIADVKLTVGMNTCQYSDAGDFLDDLEIPSGMPVTLCGHSLGGAIAQVIGNRYRLPFVTFNAPGVGIMSKNVGEMATSPLGGLRVVGSIVSTLFHPIQAAQDLGSIFYSVKGVNFRLGNDAVGMVGVHFGKVITVPYKGDWNGAKTHSIVTFISHLEKTVYKYLHLDDLVD